MKNKKTTINPKNNDDKRVQYDATVDLNDQQIGNNAERISKIKLFIGKYNWKEINFPSHKKDMNKSNNKSIALNILYIQNNTEEIRHAYKSKHNLKSENQAIMVSDGKKCRYLTIKNYYYLLQKIIT